VPGVDTRVTCSGRQEARAAAVESRVATLERRLAVEMTMREGLNRLASEYEATQNAAAKADVLAAVRAAPLTAMALCCPPPPDARQAT
jgi:hypothetical protein